MRKNSGSAVKKTKKMKLSYIQIITLLVFIYFVYTLYNQQIQINKYNSQIEMYTSDIQNKNSLIGYYKSQKLSVNSDEFIELIARKELGFVKPYEKIFVDVNK
ncbi:MAG: septum formation initiator family protein [Clostridia bacterium]|nr:septum formation initiator family protein [Clostridia bacterium]